VLEVMSTLSEGNEKYLKDISLKILV
jgi:hypothetical protein